MMLRRKFVGSILACLGLPFLRRKNANHPVYATMAILTSHSPKPEDLVEFVGCMTFGINPDRRGELELFPVWRNRAGDLVSPKGQPLTFTPTDPRPSQGSFIRTRGVPEDGRQPTETLPA